MVDGFAAKANHQTRVEVEILEGEHDQQAISMLNFPNIEAIQAFWRSPDYVQIKNLSEGMAPFDVLGFPRMLDRLKTGL